MYLPAGAATNSMDRELDSGYRRRRLVRRVGVGLGRVRFGLVGYEHVEVVDGLAEGEEVILSDVSDYLHLEEVTVDPRVRPCRTGPGHGDHRTVRQGRTLLR